MKSDILNDIGILEYLYHKKITNEKDYIETKENLLKKIEEKTNKLEQ